MSLSRAATSNIVIRLEQHVGSQLLQRTTRSVTLTESGRQFHQQCVRILADLEGAERAAGVMHSEPRGELRVVAPTNFGLGNIGDAISGFLLTYTKIQVTLDLSDLEVDPISAGYDIAIRVDTPRDTAQASLIARKIIPTSRRLLCASPQYLRSRGVPTTPTDLLRHDCISYSYLAKPTLWQFLGPQGPIEVKVSGPLVTGHGQILRAAALQGLGIAYTPRVFVGDALSLGDLEVVLPDYRVPDVNIFSVFPAARRGSAKVRAFNDYMASFFAKVAASGAAAN